MKRNLLLLLILLCVVIGSYFLFQQYEKNQLVKEAKIKTEEFIYRNFEDIYSIEIATNEHKFNPMGALSIKGYVNQDPKLVFTINFILVEDKLGEVTSILRAKDFPPRTEECQNAFCE